MFYTNTCSLVKGENECGRIGSRAMPFSKLEGEDPEIILKQVYLRPKGF